MKKYIKLHLPDPPKIAFEDLGTDSLSIHDELNSLIFRMIENKNSELEEEIDKTFEKLYNRCVVDNYYWQYCPVEVYKATFQKRLAEYLKTFINANENDFINLNINDIKAEYPKDRCSVSGLKTREMVYYLFRDDEIISIKLNDLISEQLRKNFFYSNQRKLEFIVDYCGTPELEVPEQEATILDYSNNSNAEKIVFLHELGILEFLRKQQPFGMSTNKLAEVVSSFTGVKQTTAQSYLNPIFSKDVDKSKSPLTDKNLKTVSEKLMKMGFIK